MQPLKGKFDMRKVFLVLIALMVLLLAAGGDFASQLLEQRTQINLQAEDKDTEDNNSPVLQIKSASIFNSIVHISSIIFHADLNFEFDLPVISETKAHSVIETALNFTRHSRTLFQIIISPNAP